MDRRENLKLLLSGSLVTGYVLTTGCGPATSRSDEHINWPGYGRTEQEKLVDEKLMKDLFFTEKERNVVTILADKIIPADAESGGAIDAGVTDFIEFMMKDYPPFQHRMRGGLMWLEHYSNTQYGLSFEKLSTEQQIEIIDAIAYPDSASKEVKHGVEFFNLIRNLVCTGFFTTKMGVDYLGYQGNRPNQWDGVPEEVMQKYGVELDEKYASVYLDIESQNTIVQWDDEGNIIG